MARPRTVALALVILLAAAGGLPGQGRRPTNEWQLPPGLRAEIECSGLDDPIAIAAVPTPGTDSEDPVCFVAERRGVIKVVTNSGKIRTFATAPFGDAPDARTELIGIAIAPAPGYVFLSFLAGPAEGPLESRLVRFECDPVDLSGALRAKHALRGLMRDALGSSRGVIGPVAVRGDELFVGVDCRGDPRLSRDPDSAEGKILRATLAGAPLPDNPFHTDDGVDSARDWVWSVGLRRPRALAVAGDVLFATDSGLGSDRLVAAERGSDHHFDGTRWSLGIEAAFQLDCPTAPGGLAFATLGAGAGRLLVVLAGEERLPIWWRARGSATVVACRIGGAPRYVPDPPAAWTTWCGDGAGSILAISASHEHVFALSGDGVVLRFSTDPGAPTPDALVEPPFELVAERGCITCHVYTTSAPPDLGRSLQPELLASRLMKRLHSSDYLQQLAAVDALPGEPYRSYDFARKDVREANGLARVRSWLRHKLVEPRFDDPASEMPHHGLTTGQAARVVDLLLTGLPETEDLGLIDRLRLVVADLVPHPRQRHLLFFLAAGCAIGAVVATAFWSIRKRVRADRPRKV